jgi:DNA-directed RNA polymerase subunit alpha
MQNIALPKKIEFRPGEQPNQEIITVEPLFPGYGMTLGNSLRRILLSSLPGAAVIGVKIKGASHEFMALPHVKEDVLEIILNLKQLRLKVFTEEEIRLDLKVKGKKVVTAKDITKDSKIEIKNEDLVIANITDDSGSLEMEIFVKEGRGYRMAESTKKENREIGYIEIDSIFSPVTIVSISVENTRVGKMTNWDKLILDVKTDGTISCREAFTEAVKIVVEQYASFLPIMEGRNEEISEEAELAEDNEEAIEVAEEIEETVDSEEDAADEEAPKKSKKSKK